MSFWTPALEFGLATMRKQPPSDIDPAPSLEQRLAALRNATTARPAQPLAFLELGDLLGQLGRFDEAIAVFEEGLALEPRAIVLRVGLGYVHLNRGDREAARLQFETVRAAAPERYDGMVGLAHALAAQGEYLAASDLYLRALDLQPDNVVTRLARAKCLLEMGERAAGEAELRIAARGGPERLWPAITALASTPHGRVFLTAAAAARFLGVDAPPTVQARNRRR